MTRRMFRNLASMHELWPSIIAAYKAKWAMPNKEG